MPVARGGTNDINNLQTLCRECNRMKHTDEWIGGETDFETVQNELSQLNENLKETEIKLENATTEEDKIELKFKIVKLTERIKVVQEKFVKLKIEYENWLSEQEEARKKELLYKQLYVEYDDMTISLIAYYLFPDVSNANKIPKEKVLKHLLEKFSAEDLKAIILKGNEIQKLCASLKIPYYPFIKCIYAQYEQFGVDFFNIDLKRLTLSFPWNDETITKYPTMLFEEFTTMADPFPLLTCLDLIKLKNEWDLKFNLDLPNTNIPYLSYDELKQFYEAYRWAIHLTYSKFNHTDIGFVTGDEIVSFYIKYDMITDYYRMHYKKDVLCIEIRPNELYYIIKFDINWEKELSENPKIKKE